MEVSTFVAAAIVSTYHHWKITCRYRGARIVPFQREFHHVALYLREILILAENGDEKRYGDGDSFFPSLSNRQCPASCDKNDRDIKWKDFNYDGSNPGRNICVRIFVERYWTILLDLGKKLLDRPKHKSTNLPIRIRFAISRVYNTSTLRSKLNPSLLFEG